MFTAWGAFLIGTLMLFVPLMIILFISFLVFGHAIGKGTALTALAATGIVFGIGTATIMVFTALIAIEESLLYTLYSLLLPLYAVVLFVPVKLLYELPTIRAIVAALLIGFSSIVMLASVPITVGLVLMLV